ncbi:ABC transporter permease [Fulvivirgaceae bacterium BMA12]|uniref:ABC transporter permease n=1 Tax=Agaribacillus aureus TaxID=3051825 RepID=A0ABT8L891_9BACT|nr:ABC transporter permease [Fulvivirgaceae bacterium BMA12]
MLRSHFKIATRALLKNNFFSLLNIFGLAVGMGSCLLIVNYVVFETSFDEFHQEKDNIYRITHEFYEKGELKSKSAAAYAPLAPAMMVEIPEVRQAVRVHPVTGTVTCGDTPNIKRFKEERIYFADSNFFKVFSFTTLSGDSKDPLGQNNTTVITKSTAEKYFGKQIDPVGQEIYWNDGNYEATFTVTGIIDNVPQNSHLKFDFLFSFSTLESLDANGLVPLSQNWGWPGFYTYILVSAGLNPSVIESKLAVLTEKYTGFKLKSEHNSGPKFYAQRMSSIHLNSYFSDEISVNSDIKSIRFLSLIALFVLLMAYINFINLSIAGSMQRAREVAVRKLVGSRKLQLIKQFLLESLLLNSIAFSLAFIGYHLVLPNLYLFTGENIPNSLNENRPILWCCVVALFLLGTLLSSIYPTFILAGYKPGKILKGSFRNNPNRSISKKALVVFQFTTSIAMVTGAIVVHKQIDYLRHKELGLNLQQTLVVNGSKISTNQSNPTNPLALFKAGLMKQQAVRSVSLSSAVPGTEVNQAMMYKLLPADWENGKVIRLMNIDTDFIDQYGMTIIAGRAFSEINSRDLQGKTLLINEAAALLLGFQNADKTLHTKIVSATGEVREVVGLVKNYHQKSPIQSYEPLMFAMNPNTSDYISVRFQANHKNNDANLKNTLKSIERIFKNHFPADAFSYFFIDDFFDRQFKSHVHFMRLFSLFTLLTLFVACLGLFGLSAYTTRQRTKEIGIRKVLGASSFRILTLLSLGYIKLLLIAFLIALPFCNYMITEWLRQYPFKIPLNGWFFIVPAILVVIIALIAIGGQTVKTASINPTKALRYE